MAGIRHSKVATGADDPSKEVNKGEWNGDHVIDDGSIALVKLATMATASIIGRYTAGTGAPEVLSAATVKVMLGVNNVDNTSDVNKPVSTAQAAADTAALNSAKAYADGLVVGLLDDRGSYNASGNTFPASGGSGTAGAIMKGDIWYISGAGTLGGTAVNIGDSVRALADSPGQTASNWSVLESNIGFVPENTANKSTSVETDKTSDTKFPSVKSVYDWGVGKFAALAGLSTQVFSVAAASANDHAVSRNYGDGRYAALAGSASQNFSTATLNISGVANINHTPSSGWGLNCAADTSVNSYITLANDATYDLAAGSGLIVLHCNNDGRAAVFLAEGGLVTEIIDPSGNYTPTFNTAGKINFYLNGGATAYQIQNKTGGQRSVFVSTIKTRAAT